MGGFGKSLWANAFGVLMLVWLCSPALAQGIPDVNVNVIGINPPGDPGLAVPDTGLKQQNEPSCAFKPSNPLHMLCAFNDYRGVDNPTIGDAWEGYAYSINGGQTWYSDLLPGHQGDAPSVGFEFAADPQVIAAPGISLISYIAGNRGEGAAGGLYVHRLFEINREAGAPWEPEILPQLVASGRRSLFIDKPMMWLQLDEPAGSTVSVSSTLRDGTSVTRAVPAGRLFMAYTTFEDGLSTIYVAYSDDYGVSWTTRQVSRGESLNQSASLATKGNRVCATWRRFQFSETKDTQPHKNVLPSHLGEPESDNSNAIMVSCSKFRGDKWFRPAALASGPSFFPFDQGTTETSFRVNSYPVMISDGNRFYVFWSRRDGAASPFFARVVYSSSLDGRNWTVSRVLDNAAIGHQFMPVAAAARGVIQVAWYDTRNSPFQDVFVQDILDDSTNPPTRVLRNPGDLRTAQIVGGVATSSVQVSRYIEGILEGDVGPARQLQFNFLNDRMFRQGTVPFHGDYPHVGAPLFRLEGGEWVSNAAPGADEQPVDFVVSFTDNRDVRGNVWENLADATVYTPAAAGGGGRGSTTGETGTGLDAEQGTAAPGLAAQALTTESGGSQAQGSIRMDSVEDDARADAEPDPTDVYPLCMQDGRNRDRSRDQNVYSSIVRPGVSLASPSASKPTGTVQRAHVVWISNNTDADVTYTVTIDNQPPDAPVTGRASFLQVPVAPFAIDDGGLLETLSVDIAPNSTVARTVFVTSLTPEPPISVSVSDGGAVTLGTLLLNPDERTPDIQNPDVQNPDVQNPDIQNAEVHNPDVQNAVITRVQNPDVQNPDVQNPDVQNPDVQNPDVQNPDIQNPDIQNPDVQNIALDASSTENPDLANDEVTQAQRDAGYTDITWETTNTGNTTTAFNLDAFINGDTTGLSTQLIGMRTHRTPTSRDCMTGIQVSNQVIFNLINPDLSLFEVNTNAGEFADGSAYIAPGETIFVTLRVWGDPDFDVGRVGLRAEAQSCNSLSLGTMECDPPFMQVGEYDSGPEITGPASPILVEASSGKAGTGAFVDLSIQVSDNEDESVSMTCSWFEFGEPFDETGNDQLDLFFFVEIDEPSDVICSATDSDGNFTEEIFTVIAQDTTPPQIFIGDGESTDFFYFTCNTEYMVYYQGDEPFPGMRGGAQVHVSAFDDVDFDDVSLDCVPPSGSDETVFPPNQSTPVVCTATDTRGNSDSDTFDVVVELVSCRQ